MINRTIRLTAEDEGEIERGLSVLAVMGLQAEEVGESTCQNLVASLQMVSEMVQEALRDYSDSRALPSFSEVQPNMGRERFVEISRQIGWVVRIRKITPADGTNAGQQVDQANVRTHAGGLIRIRLDVTSAIHERHIMVMRERIKSLQKDEG